MHSMRSTAYKQLGFHFGRTCLYLDWAQSRFSDEGYLVFPPLGCFFRAIGGIAVPRRHKGKRPLTEVVAEMFNESDRLTIAITPEGTRSRTSDWHTGFLRIAKAANVPIVLGVLDFATKNIMIEHTFEPTGDVDTDMRRIKEFYRPYKGKHPDKFTTE